MPDKLHSFASIKFPQFFMNYPCYKIDKIQKFEMITEINNIIVKGEYHRDRPLYQTKGDIFSSNRCFSALKKSFYYSIKKYLSMAANCYFKYPLYMKSWAYVNWKNSGYVDNGYHCHDNENPTAISGIYYLHQPISDPSASTTFIIGGKLFVLPVIENTWFLFPSSCYHRPGFAESISRRYVVSADVCIGEAYIDRYLEDPQIALY
jgi:hypothetical protein